MSKVSVFEKMIMAKMAKPIEEFNYDDLAGPTIPMIFSRQELDQLIYIATSQKLAAKVQKKYKMIDDIMKPRGFVRSHAGTNRLVYYHLEDSRICVKVAVDKAGMRDSPREYRNQQYFKPFCCKIFDVDPSGVVAVVERVNPISSLEEFLSIATDVFYLLVNKIVGEYVVDDLGTRSFMNFGVRADRRYTFGPVIIDYPYAYKLDPTKLKCTNTIENPFTGKVEYCRGDIDYRPGFNGLYCTKCGKEYRAIDLAVDDDSSILPFHYDSTDEEFIRDLRHKMRARVIDNGVVLYDSGKSSSKILSKGELKEMEYFEIEPDTEYEVVETIRTPSKTMAQIRDDYRNEMRLEFQRQLYNKLMSEENDNHGEIVPVVATQKIQNLVETNRGFYSEYMPRPEPECQDIEVVATESADDGYDSSAFDLLSEIDKLPNHSQRYKKNNNGNLDQLNDIFDESVLQTKKIDLPEVKTESKDIKIQDDVQSPQVEPIIPDEKVQLLVDYVAHKDDPLEEIDESKYLIDPEQDKNSPHLNPMSRPYAKKKDETISVYAKMQPNLEHLVKPRTMPNILGGGNTKIDI